MNSYLKRIPSLSLASLSGWLCALVLLWWAYPLSRSSECSCPAPAHLLVSPRDSLSIPQQDQASAVSADLPEIPRVAPEIPQHSTPEPGLLGSPRHDNQAQRHSSLAWHAERLVEQIETLIHLEAPTREAVKRAIMDQQKVQYSGSLRLDDAIRQALGSQASVLEQQLEAQAEHRMRKERERELAVLSYKLKLSPEQDEQIQEVFVRLEAALAPARVATEKLIDEGMQKHLDPDLDKSQLREAMAIIEQSQQTLRSSRQQFLASELRSILSPEQYQAWLNTESAE